MPARPIRVALPLLALLLNVARPVSQASAECPSHPADVAPGVLGTEMPVPTWTVQGNGVIDVQDVLTLLRAAVGLQTPVWSAPASGDCPAVPGDVAPGAADAGFSPPRWTPAPDGSVSVGDVLAVLRMAVSLIAIDPAWLRPVVAPAGADARVVTGTVLDSVSEQGVPGVTVTAFASESPVGRTRTDAQGKFALQALPAGALTLLLDGSTSTAPTGKFSSLEVQVQSETEGATSLRALTLPNEEDPDGATGKFTGDESGELMEEVALSSEDGDVGLASEPGGKVTIGDEPAEGDVDLSVVPLEGDELPGGLADDESGEDLSSTGEAAVGPADGKFTGGGAGLSGAAGEPPGFDLTLPNRKGFPLGTSVDIHWWDGRAGAWVNCSRATGRRGTVVDVGGGRTAVFAPGVATRGGLYAAAVPIDFGCTTTVTGRVVDQSGAPLSGVFVDSAFGVFGRTGPDGTFRFEALPAYSGVDLGDCAGLGFELRLRGGLELGGSTSVVSVPDVDVVPGGYLDLLDLTLSVPHEACLSGLVVKNGVPQSGPVRLEGPSPGVLSADAEGRFFASGLTPGHYTAFFLFPGEVLERGFELELLPRQCATIRLELHAGSGSRRIEVHVYYDDDDQVLTPSVPAEGALVELRGSDAGSLAGLQALTGPAGTVVFDSVSGPFQVTALFDVSIQIVQPPPGQTPAFSRTGAMLTTDALPTGRIGIPLLTAEDDPLIRDVDEGFMEGAIANLPVPDVGEALSVGASLAGAYEYVGQGCCVDPFGPHYFTAAYRDPYDVVFGLFEETDFVAKPLELAVFGPFPTEPFGPGEPYLVADLDYDSVPPILFDQSLGLGYTGFATIDNQKFFRLFTHGDGERGFRVDLEFVPPDFGLPPSVRWPDPASPGATPWDLLLEVFSEPTIPQFPGQYTLMPVPAPLPAPLTVPFVPPPEFVGLTLEPNTSESEVAGTTFEFTTVGTAVPGYDALIYDCSRGASVPGEPENAIFVVYLAAASSQSQALPPTPWPVVFPDSFLIVEAESVRSTGLPASFQTLFDDRVAERFPAALQAMAPVHAAFANRWYSLAP